MLKLNRVQGVGKLALGEFYVTQACSPAAPPRLRQLRRCIGWWNTISNQLKGLAAALLPLLFGGDCHCYLPGSDSDLVKDYLQPAATFALLASIGLSSAAYAGPARMLIIARGTSDSHPNPIAVLDFDSFEDCEATADHVAQVRTPEASTVGLTGTWKSNFKKRTHIRQEPRVAMLCLPSVDEIPAVAEGLKAKDFYRDPY